MSIPPADSERRSSAPARRADGESSAKRPTTDSTTPIIKPANNDDQPTIISQQRSRNGFDSHLGESLVGRQLGHFELVEAVGAGGMAAVIRARDLDLGRTVALKILPPDMAVDPENVSRFRNEARAAAKLDHDNIARVYHCGDDQGLYFIAFEFVEGDNLRALMEANGGTIPVAEGVSILLQVAAGLAHAHERGVVHRDIKPSNIIVTPDGRAKIVDMGLARSMDNKASGQITQSNVTLGTFDYISPEQALDPRSADIRSDIYSLGCTFYHAFTGHVPVPEGTAAKKLDAHKNQLPPDPRSYNPSIPDELAAVIGRMMAKNAEARYQHPDHLSAHLRAIAQKLGISTGPVPLSQRSYDEPIPPPPKLSLSWIITTVAVLVLVVFVLVNANTPSDPPPLWPSVKNGANAKPTPNNVQPEPPPTPMVVNGPRDADDVAELVTLLKQGVKHIRLTREEYDLSTLNVEALFQGTDLRLEGIGLPQVRLGYASTATGAIRHKAFTFQGTGQGSLTIRKLRFIAATNDMDTDSAAFEIRGFDRVNLEECTFKTNIKAAQNGPTLVALHGGTVSLKQCYFAPGSIALSISGGTKLTATECAFGPQYAVFHVQRLGDDPTEHELKLHHCSGLLSTGYLVDVDDQTACQISVGHCLFGGPSIINPQSALPLMVHQRGTRSASTRYDAMKLASDTLTNVYHNVAAYAEGEMIYSFAECAKERLPIRDVEPPLKGIPWDERDPLTLLSLRPMEAKRAFAPNPRLAVLRVPSNRHWEVIGTKYLATEPLFGLPLPTPESEPRDASIKVWDPSLASADDAPPGVFPTLKMAIAAVKKGDTLLIRHTGRLEIDPCEFVHADTNLTIKPDGTSRPLLVPVATSLKKTAALFKLYGGRLVLDGLHFRFPADRTPALVAIPSGGQFECRNAIISFDDAEDLNAVVLADPKNEMMMAAPSDRGAVPKIVFENVVLRGKGRLLSVRGSRPFELDVKNSLAVLDSSLLEIDPAPGDPAANGSAVVKLHRTTTYLSGPLLHLRAGEKKTEMGPSGLAKTEIHASQCLFVPATENREGLVRAERFDTREQLEKWFTWSGKHNLYGYDKKKVMLEIRTNDGEAMPLKVINGDRWLEIAGEEGDPFAAVKFEFVAPEAGRAKAFLAVKPNDLRIKAFDPPRPDAEPDLGAPSDLPRPFAEE